MRQSHFEAIIAVQNRHIERLEKMVEELFGVLRKEKPTIQITKPESQVLPDEEPEVEDAVPSLEIMPGALFTDQG